MNPKYPLKAMLGGIAGTAVMTFMATTVAPMMGIPPMNPAKMLAMQMGNMMAAGWMMHFGIGAVLAIGYARFFVQRIPGPVVVRGAIYSLIPFFMAQLIVMPMMGMGLFSGSMMMAGGSLIGHLVYGMVLGSVYGMKETCHVASAEAAA